MLSKDDPDKRPEVTGGFHFKYIFLGGDIAIYVMVRHSCDVLDQRASARGSACHSFGCFVYDALNIRISDLQVAWFSAELLSSGRRNPGRVNDTASGSRSLIKD